jgi:hypothetical protein
MNWIMPNFWPGAMFGFMNKYSCSILFACLFTINIYAQSEFLPGYIIENSGTKVNGWIKIGSAKDNSKKCIFKPALSTKITEYSPYDILCYKVDTLSMFKSFDITDNGSKKRVFLEYLLKGRLNLLIYSKRAASNPRFFIEKADSNFIELENTTDIELKNGGQNIRVNEEYKTTLKRYLYDCPPVIPQLRKSKFETKSLLELSKTYNNLTCPGEQCLTFKRISRNINIIIGPVLTVYSKILTQSTDSDFIRRAPIISMGAFLDISNFDFLSPRLSSHSEISFLPEYYVRVLLGDYYYSSQLRFTEVINYYFSTNKFRPFLGLGPRYYFHLNKKPKEGILNGYAIKSSVQLGILAHGGFDYLISERIKVMFAVNYEYSLRHFDQPETISEVRNISFQVGAGYKLK